MKLKKKYTIEEIASTYSCLIIGDKSIMIDSVCSLANCKSKSLSYISDKKFLSLLKDGKPDCLITTEHIAKEINDMSISCIIHENPLLIFTRLINESYDVSYSSLFIENNNTNSIPKSTLIGKNTILGNNVIIGEDCIIHPNVTIYDETIIGKNVVIHSGAVIGSDGFGLVKDGDQWLKVPHIGNVVINNNVEIGANTTIDRGTLDSTLIYNNVKIDNQVHIAHNVIIGENTAIAACVGIAGSTVVGKNCTIGGGSGLNGHIVITDNVHIHGMTMVTKSILEEGMYASGTTVEPASSWRKNQARFKELDSLAKTIKKKT